MKIRTVIAGNIALLLLATLSVRSADQMTVYSARSGSKMRIEGTANVIHTSWQIESPFIAGMMQVGPNFPTAPGQVVAPGAKLDAKANAVIMVRSLHSVNEDGTRYSDSMDEIMCEHLKEAQFKQINYKLTELTLKEAPKAKDAPYVCDAKGDLTIAGVTNPITMVVNILPLPDNKLEITGNTAVKMSDYKVPIVDKSIIGLAHIKTGDEVKLVFKWMLAQRKVPAAASK
jgi:polyisoprenoid-binding protein YceI